MSYMNYRLAPTNPDNTQSVDQSVLALSQSLGVPQLSGADSTPAVTKLLDETWIKYEEAEKAMFDACEASGFGLHKCCSENKDSDGIYRRHVFGCWKSKAKPPSANKLAAAAAIPPEKKRKRTSNKGTCEWQCVITYPSRDHLWRFKYVKDRGVHNHEMEEDTSVLPSVKKRMMEELNLDAEIELFAVHPKATSASIATELSKKYPQTRIKKHDIGNTLARFRDEGRNEWGKPQFGTLANAKPGFWYRLYSKLPHDARASIWKEFVDYNNSVAAANSSNVSASVSENANSASQSCDNGLQNAFHNGYNNTDAPNSPDFPR